MNRHLLVLLTNVLLGGIVLVRACNFSFSNLAQ